MPKIRKAKSQSFRSHHRRSPSERKHPGFVNLSQAQFNNANADKRHSPASTSDRSPGSYSSKSPAVSRQNTVKYHRRKNSISTSGHTLNLNQGRRSPLTLLQDRTPPGRKSPNFLSHDAYNSDYKSPISSPSQRRSPLGFQEKLSPNSAMTLNIDSRYSSVRDRNRSSPRSSVSSDKRGTSPMSVPIPPITISNPSETYPITTKSIPSTSEKTSSPSPRSPTRSPEHKKDRDKDEKKEKPSVMKEILNFVRKPSKKVTTQTSKFTAAFTRRESGSGSPLMRQSTFSSIPNTSSRAGKHMITKQQSQIESVEPKMSFRSKMSLKLRRFDRRDKDKRSSGDEVSDKETSDSGKAEKHSPEIFELENVHFNKVGETNVRPEEGERTEAEAINLQAKIEHVYEELKKSLETIIDKGEKKPDSTIQCPTFEIEPPSRRASFDPPRSPFLENLRSLSSTDHSRVDSAGESFEMVEHRESSFEERYSSVSTSFDISRYQSTSYEDQTSSFEVIEGEGGVAQVRKGSIELVDAETFAKSSPKGRKSSLETHFDLADNYKPKFVSKAIKSEPRQQRKKHFPAHYRPRSPLSYQTSSNYSSRDSYESSSYDPEVRHYFLPATTHKPPPRPKSGGNGARETGTSNQQQFLGPTDTSSGSEFEPPSPRRAASASPKHTFTFRIVMKKVESSPDAICPSSERRSRDRIDRHKRRDSRRKKLLEQGKSF